MTQTYKIEITPTGMHVDAAGFKGNSCTVLEDELEAWIEKEAGITVAAKTQKKKLEQCYHTAPGHQVKH